VFSDDSPSFNAGSKKLCLLKFSAPKQGLTLPLDPCRGGAFSRLSSKSTSPKIADMWNAFSKSTQFLFFEKTGSGPRGDGQHSFPLSTVIPAVAARTVGPIPPPVQRRWRRLPRDDFPTAHPSVTTELEGTAFDLFSPPSLSIPVRFLANVKNYAFFVFSHSCSLPLLLFLP